MSSLPFGTSIPFTTRGENTRLGFQGGSWRRSPSPPPVTCTRTYLDGKCDVRVGAEAPAPVAGAVVEAAACEDSHGVGRAGQGHAPGAPHPCPPRDSSGPPGWPGKQTPPGQVTAPGALGWGAALPSWHPSCLHQAPGPAPGHSPTLMAQPRSTASFPAFENKHRLRQAGAEPFTRSCADSPPL